MFIQVGGTSAIKIKYDETMYLATEISTIHVYHSSDEEGAHQLEKKKKKILFVYLFVWFLNVLVNY